MPPVCPRTPPRGVECKHGYPGICYKNGKIVGVPQGQTFTGEVPSEVSRLKRFDVVLPPEGEEEFPEPATVSASNWRVACAMANQAWHPPWDIVQLKTTSRLVATSNGGR